MNKKTKKKAANALKKSSASQKGARTNKLVARKGRAKKKSPRTATLTVQRVTISFAASGEGSLTYSGTTVPCLGNPKTAYTQDLTVQGVEGVDKFPVRWSDEFQVNMPYAVLIMGQRGIYIHEGPDNLRDNEGTSAGCIHLAPGNAKRFYDWVSSPTRITIAYPW